MVNKSQLPGPQTLLVDLRLDRVDLVHTGSNTRADILLTKGKEQNAMPEDLQGLLSALKPEQAEIVKSALAAVEKAKTDEVAVLAAKVETLEKAAPATVTAPATTPEADAILKGASPEVLAHIEKMRGQIADLQERDAENLAKSRYAVVKAIPCEEAEMLTVLKTASPAVLTILEKAAKAIEEKVLTPVGKTGDTNVSGATSEVHYEKLAKAAKELMTKTPGITFEKAFTDACSEDPDTYAQYVKEAN